MRCPSPATPRLLPHLATEIIASWMIRMARLAGRGGGGRPSGASASRGLHVRSSGAKLTARRDELRQGLRARKATSRRAGAQAELRVGLREMRQGVRRLKRQQARLTEEPGNPPSARMTNATKRSCIPPLRRDPRERSRTPARLAVRHNQSDQRRHDRRNGRMIEAAAGSRLRSRRSRPRFASRRREPQRPSRYDRLVRRARLVALVLVALGALAAQTAPAGTGRGRRPSSPRTGRGTSPPRRQGRTGTSRASPARGSCRARTVGRAGAAPRPPSGSVSAASTAATRRRSAPTRTAARPGRRRTTPGSSSCPTSPTGRSPRSRTRCGRATGSPGSCA